MRKEEKRKEEEEKKKIIIPEDIEQVKQKVLLTSAVETGLNSYKDRKSENKLVNKPLDKA